jgi:hypothetical protein
MAKEFQGIPFKFIVVILVQHSLLILLIIEKLAGFFSIASRSGWMFK